MLSKSLIQQRFVYLDSLGFVDLNNVVQIYNPTGAEVSLDDAPEIAVRFASDVFDGSAITRVVKITNREEIELLIRELGLLKAREVSWLEVSK